MQVDSGDRCSRSSALGALRIDIYENEKQTQILANHENHTYLWVECS